MQRVFHIQCKTLLILWVQGRAHRVLKVLKVLKVFKVLQAAKALQEL
jgi:hypothetical protein